MKLQCDNKKLIKALAQFQDKTSGGQDAARSFVGNGWWNENSFTLQWRSFIQVISSALGARHAPPFSISVLDISCMHHSVAAANLNLYRFESWNAPETTLLDQFADGWNAQNEVNQEILWIHRKVDLININTHFSINWFKWVSRVVIFHQWTRPAVSVIMHFALFIFRAR